MSATQVVPQASDIGIDQPLDRLGLKVASIVVIVARRALAAPGGVLGGQDIDAGFALRDRLVDREERGHRGVLLASHGELALPSLRTLGVPDLAGG